MPVYKVKYEKRDGGLVTTHAEGVTPDDALRRENIPSSAVRSISRDIIEEWDRKLPKSTPSLAVQASAVSVFSAKTASGLNPSVVFDQTAAMFPEFRKQLGAIARVHKVSEKIQLLNFDPQLQLLAQVGEQSGLIAEVLNDAANEAIERNKLLGDLKMNAVPSLGIAGLGILTLLALPVFMVSSLRSIMETPGLVFKKNFCTDFILITGDLMKHVTSWVILVAAIIAIAVTTRRWWPLVKDLPGFKTVENFFRLTRSYRFVSAFLPMFQRGVKLTETIQMMEKYARGNAKQVYTNMLTHMGRGGSFSSSFQDPYWDDKLANLMSGFDDMKQSAKIQLLENVRPLLAQDMKRAGNSLTGFITVFGMAVTAASTLAVFFGLTVPLMSVTVAM